MSPRTHALSLAGAALITLAIGCMPSPEEEQANKAAVVDYTTKMGALYTKVRAAVPTLSSEPCKDNALAAKLQKEAFDDYGTAKIVHVYGPYMKRFSATAADYTEVNKGAPWSWLTDSSYAGHFVKPVDARESWGDTAQRVKKEFLPRRYVLVIWPDDEEKNREPIYHPETKTFDGGMFDGWLVVGDVVDGSLACHTRAAIRSSSSVEFRTGGRRLGKLLDKDPAKAIRDDFQDAMEKAIKVAVPGPKVEVSTAMGALFD